MQKIKSLGMKAIMSFLIGKLFLWGFTLVNSFINQDFLFVSVGP